MTERDDAFDPFEALMRAEGLPEIAIETFRHYVGLLRGGQTGLIPEADILPVDDLPDADALPPEVAGIGQRAIARAAMIKLNGGLGTGMGLEQAKSLLIVKEGLSFLDIIARQALDAGAPLVLMNSFSTRDDSLAALAAHPALSEGRALPLDFMQHKVPKILVDGLGPARWPEDPELGWCPPGHGDIYTALLTSGMLDAMRAAGLRYAFVSNADNLGAVLDPAILGHFVASGQPFMMEVADRTAADRKGGHLARRLDGQLILRESAQCPPEDADAFQDTSRHRYFNTNSLWLDLDAVADALAARQGVLGLPMIRNLKTLDPRRADSPPVYQLETAMGSAIAVFEGAGALRVPRSRFAPVKACQDLLRVRSDACTLTDDFRVVPAEGTPEEPADVVLDNAFYKTIDDLERRFPFGPPSLRACLSLRVEGDVRFGRDVRVEGHVRLSNRSGAPVTIEDGAHLVADRAW